MSEPRPEVIRSTFLPEDLLGGTKLFCGYRDGWFIVYTRWQQLKRSRDIDKALKSFDDFSMGEIT